MLEDLVLFQKLYDLVVWFFPIVNRFPKKQRFVLGQQIQNELLELVKLVIRANLEEEKREHLRHASVRLDMTRVLVRLAKDLRFLSVAQYGTAVERLNEVGRLLAGWMRRYA